MRKRERKALRHAARLAGSDPLVDLTGLTCGLVPASIDGGNIQLAISVEIANGNRIAEVRGYKVNLDGGCEFPSACTEKDLQIV